jgi:hypothetical protein
MVMRSQLVGDRHLEPVVVLTWPPGKIRTAQDFIDMMKLGEQFAATLDAAEVARWESAERDPATQEKVTMLQTSREGSEGSS